MINSNVLSFRIRQDKTRNITRKHRRQFCIMLIVFGELPEILPTKSGPYFHQVDLIINNSIPRNARGAPLLGLAKSIYYNSLAHSYFIRETDKISSVYLYSECYSNGAHKVLLNVKKLSRQGTSQCER